MQPQEEREWQTRKYRIDGRLIAQGWSVVRFDPSRVIAGYNRHAIEEYPTDYGPADYALVSNGRILAVVEAKKLSLGPQNVLIQAERYSRGASSNPFNFDGLHVPFLYATNGEVLWFHDIRYDLNRSRPIHDFHTPAALEEMLGRDFEAACARLIQLLNSNNRLRPYQADANTAVEKAIIDRKRQMLVAMATGTGKTFTTVNQVYRLMKSGVAQRILFLVDRRALEGVSAPPPFGGNQRTIVVTLDPDKLRQYRISPEEAIAAVNNATLVMPSGNMWTGETNRIARTNATLGGNLNELLSTPIRPVSGRTIYLRDIATIDNGTDIITSYAHVNGKRTVYIPVTKRADASTLAVIGRVKAAMPRFKRAVPDDVDVRLEFDQSGYVSTAIRNLVTEGVLGALLTGLMVLIFLRDWRSALIVVMNIPFALFAAVLCLWAAGQTINIMTLGGLALAVGVLVDEATVSIENIHTQLGPGINRAWAVVRASEQKPAAALALHFAFYDFYRIHRTLKVTPAMESGITDHVWTTQELLEAA